MSFLGTKEGVFFVARACETEGCEAVHVARVPFTERGLPHEMRNRPRGEAVRFLVNLKAMEDAKRDQWIFRYLDTTGFAEVAWCPDCHAEIRVPTQWPSYEQFVAHLAYGGVWCVKTPQGVRRYHTRVHNRVPEIRREGASEWEVYNTFSTRREVTITPEYVTQSDTSSPRDAYPTPGAHDARRSDSSMDTIDWNAKGEALARAHRAEGLPRTELLWVLVSRVRDGLETEIATLSGPALDAAEQAAIKGYVKTWEKFNEQ